MPEQFYLLVPVECIDIGGMGLQCFVDCVDLLLKHLLTSHSFLQIAILPPQIGGLLHKIGYVLLNSAWMKSYLLMTGVMDSIVTFLILTVCLFYTTTFCVV